MASTDPRLNAALNGDLERRVVIDTRAMEWSTTPSATVWRKRLHRVGPAESGQVTSVVRYAEDSRFPAHEHPEGEEILVLSGTFSDEHGDWHAGSYLLNPEGFRHAPFSRGGCELFVKLRQFPGVDREHVVVETASADWLDGDRPGVSVLPLYSQAGYADTMHLERWVPGASLAGKRYDEGAELFVLAGTFEDDDGAYTQGTWLRLPRGYEHHARTSAGCRLYVKLGGFHYLRASTA